MKRAEVAAVLLFICVFCSQCSYRDDTNAKPAPIQGVSVIRPVSAEGKVEAVPGYEVELGSEIDGKIARITIEEGSDVLKGTLIAMIENSDLKAKLQEAEAALAVSQAKLKEVESGAREEEIRSASAEVERAVSASVYAKANLDRSRELYRKGIVSRDFLDERERDFQASAAQVKKASEDKLLIEKGPKPETVKLNENAVKQAAASAEYYKRVFEKTFIKAPISGKVIRKYVQQGEMVNKDMQPYIVAIADIGKIRINAEVDETDIGRIRTGDKVEVTSFAFPGRVFRGMVKELSDYAGARKFRPNNPVRNLDMKIVQVKIDLQEQTPFKLGMTVDVKIMSK